MQFTWQMLLKQTIPCNIAKSDIPTGSSYIPLPSTHLYSQLSPLSHLDLFLATRWYDQSCHVFTGKGLSNKTIKTVLLSKSILTGRCSIQECLEFFGYDLFFPLNWKRKEQVRLAFIIVTKFLEFTLYLNSSNFPSYLDFSSTATKITIQHVLLYAPTPTQLWWWSSEALHAVPSHYEIG